MQLSSVTSMRAPGLPATGALPPAAVLAEAAAVKFGAAQEAVGRIIETDFTKSTRTQISSAQQATLDGIAFLQRPMEPGAPSPDPTIEFARAALATLASMEAQLGTTPHGLVPMAEQAFDQLEDALERVNNDYDLG